jgi:hypothetical protein
LRGENNNLKDDSAQKYNQLLTVTTELEHRLYATQNLLHDSIVKEGKPFLDINDALRGEINNLKIDSSKKYDQLLTVTTELEQRLFVSQNQLEKGIEPGKFIECTTYKQYKERSITTILDKLKNVKGFRCKFEEFYNLKSEESYAFGVLVWEDLEKFQFERLLKKSYDFRAIKPKVFMFHTTNTYEINTDKFVLVMISHYPNGSNSNFKRQIDNKVSKLCDLFISSLNY